MRKIGSWRHPMITQAEIVVAACLVVFAIVAYLVSTTTTQERPRPRFQIPGTHHSIALGNQAALIVIVGAIAALVVWLAATVH
jgi:hypothetical protein